MRFHPISCIDGYTTGFLADRTEILIRAKHKTEPEKYDFRTVRILNGQTTICSFHKDFLVDEFYLKSNGFNTRGFRLYREYWGSHYENHPVSKPQKNFPTAMGWFTNKHYVSFPLIHPDGRNIDYVLNELREDKPRPEEEKNACIWQSCAELEGAKKWFNIYLCRRCGSQYCDNCLLQNLKQKNFYGKDRKQLYPEIVNFHFCPNCYYAYDLTNSFEGIRNYIIGRGKKEGF